MTRIITDIRGPSRDLTRSEMASRCRCGRGVRVLLSIVMVAIALLSTRHAAVVLIDDRGARREPGKRGRTKQAQSLLLKGAGMNATATKKENLLLRVLKNIESPCDRKCSSDFGRARVQCIAECRATKTTRLSTLIRNLRSLTDSAASKQSANADTQEDDAAPGARKHGGLSKAEKLQIAAATMERLRQGLSDSAAMSASKRKKKPVPARAITHADGAQGSVASRERATALAIMQVRMCQSMYVYMYACMYATRDEAGLLCMHVRMHVRMCVCIIQGLQHATKRAFPLASNPQHSPTKPVQALVTPAVQGKRSGDRMLYMCIYLTIYFYTYVYVCVLVCVCR